MNKIDVGTEIKNITDQIVKKYKPEKIILFGSRSSGRVRQESDIDLLIIKDTKKKYLDRLREVAQITSSKVSTDIFVLTPKELERAILENRFMIIDEILPKGRFYMRRLKYQADVKNWLARADQDLEWAKATLRSKLYTQACFVTQQVAEKALRK